MSGTALALGTVAALAAAGLVRRGSRATDFVALIEASPTKGRQELHRYLETQIIPELHDAQVGDWECRVEDAWVYFIHPDLRDVEVYATPGFECIYDIPISIQVADEQGCVEEVNADSIPVVKRELRGLTCLWTGDVDEDLRRYLDAMKPVLDAVERRHGQR